MKTCPLCHESAGFRVKLTDDGAQQTCLGCKAVIPASAIVDDEDDEAVSVVRQARAITKPALQRATANGPLDIIRATKQRIRFLNGEIKQREKCEAERDKLVRLLEAAKAEKHKTIEAAVTRLVPRRHSTAGTGN